MSGIAPADVRSVACSVIGPCMLPVDAVGEPLMNAVLYGVDTRAGAEIEELTTQIGEKSLVEHCGQALTSQSVGPKILWLRRNRPEIFARTAKIVNSTTYLVWKLTGRYVLDHYSAINTGPIYLAASNEWSDVLAPDLLPLEKLPELLWMAEIAGSVTKAGGHRTRGRHPGHHRHHRRGLRSHQRRRARSRRHACYVWLHHLHHRTGCRPSPRSATLVRAMGLSRRARGVGGPATSGTLSHWFREQFAREFDPVTAVITLAAEAEASPPGARGLVVLPYFSGERTPIHDPRAHGVIFGLNLTHTRGDIYRAVFEGIACATNHVFETYVEAGQEPRCLLAAGGGVQNRVWAQATSDRESERKRWVPPMATPSSPLLPSAMSAEATSAHGIRLPTRSFPTRQRATSTNTATARSARSIPAPGTSCNDVSE